jgi:SAM-dependent methyltransferase
MEEYNETTFGDRFSSVYDDWFSEFEDSTIQILAELTHGGRALELGIGTGRIALPLSDRGIDVKGIDASQAMLAKLKAKPGGENIPVSLGNFADVDVEGQFDLIFVVFNTIFVLQNQAEQIRCFKNVAKRLTPDGVFVIEAFVPNLTRFTDKQTVRVLEQDQDGVRLDIAQLDLLNQQITSHLLSLSEEGVHLFPIKIRYAWPAELDLMAQLANLRLVHRWGNWNQETFTNESTRHISVYGHEK